MDIELLQARSLLFRKIRSYFDNQDYLEVDTPLLAPTLIPETCLEVFKTEYMPPAGSRKESKEYYLIPSPELWMKQLLAQHRRSMYQICKCFRNGESTGRQHSPEFTMLEYYTIDADYRDSIRITEELFDYIIPGNFSSVLKPPFMRISMEEAFREWAGFDLYTAARDGTESLREEAQRLGLDASSSMDLGDLYNLIFVHAVEPKLPQDKPIVLMDYPSFVPCLARDADELRKERWELYIRGIELANCYTEEQNPFRIQTYFQKEQRIKDKTALIPHAVNTEYWKIFGTQTKDGTITQSFPACSGVAMGLDRLLMLLVERSTIDSVLPFPMS